MAGFKTHVTVSSVLGCGYAGWGYVHGFPPATAILGGALCGFSGMLPDIDSDYGVPLRETMAFTAATIPMLLAHRLAALGLQHDEMVLIGVSIYLFIRFGVTNIIRKYTVHRGMFHSIPAALTFAGIAFLLASGADLQVRYFKAGGVLAGFMSHLLLDEIYSIEWKSGRYRFKKSFGTAVKFWGDDSWANFSCYAKLVIVAAIILGEPSVMMQIQQRNPEFAQRYDALYGRFDRLGTITHQAADKARGWAEQFQPQQPGPQQPPPSFAPRSFQAESPQASPQQNFGYPPQVVAPPAAGNVTDPFNSAPQQSGEAVIRRDYDPTARPY